MGVVATQVARTQISSAQILALNATPVQIAPAPGVGRVILVDRILLKMVRTGTAYASGGALEFRYTNAAGSKVSADIAASVVTTGGAGTEFNTVAGVVTTLTPVANAIIVIDNATGAFTTGTGTAVIEVYYKISRA